VRSTLKARELLTIMKNRLEMQEEGVTAPSVKVQEYTRQLVSKLKLLDADAELTIDTSVKNQVKVVELNSGKVLAERIDYT